MLEAAGPSLNDVVKATVFVQDRANYETINEVYGEYMCKPYLARSTVQVEDLSIDIGVEMEVIALA